MTKHDLVLDFIWQFRKFGSDVADCFSNGMCYHFSLILCARFRHSARRVDDPIMNHFAVEIDDRIYDINGNITDDKDYKWVYWDKYIYEDSAEVRRIRRDCIWKVPADVLICGICDECFTDDYSCDLCGLDHQPVDPNAPCTKGRQRE